MAGEFLSDEELRRVIKSCMKKEDMETATLKMLRQKVEAKLMIEKSVSEEMLGTKEFRERARAIIIELLNAPTPQKKEGGPKEIHANVPRVVPDGKEKKKDRAPVHKAKRRVYEEDEDGEEEERKESASVKSAGSSKSKDSSKVNAKRKKSESSEEEEDDEDDLSSEEEEERRRRNKKEKHGASKAKDSRSHAKKEEPPRSVDPATRQLESNLQLLKDMAKVMYLGPSVYPAGFKEMSLEEKVKGIRRKLREKGAKFSGDFPTKDEIEKAKKIKEKEKDLEGIDLGNIIDMGSRRRAATTPQLPAKYKEASASESDSEAFSDEEADL